MKNPSIPERLLSCILTVIGIWLPAVACSQNVNRTSIDDLHFMSGSWKTTTEWGYMDEFWSKPMGNCMMSTYRCVKDGKVIFYEFMVIEQTANGVPVMRLRHFNLGSIGLEDKESPYSYPLVFLNNSKAIFEQLDKKTSVSYERLSHDTLKVILTRDMKETKSSDEFVFTLMDDEQYNAVDTKSPATETEEEKQNLAVVREMFAAFNKHDWKLMASHFADDAMFLDPSYGPEYVHQTRQQLVDKYSDINKEFPDLRDNITKIFASGDNVAVEFTATGTSGDGIKLMIHLSTIFTLKNRKIARDATYYDHQ